MMSNWKCLLTSIASRYFRNAPKAPARRTRAARPQVERLEDLVVPASTLGNYNVTTTLDVFTPGITLAEFNANPTLGSLRNAIELANTDGVFSTVRLKTNKTYNLAIDGTNENDNINGDLDIEKDVGLRIIGAGSTVRNAQDDIDADREERIFHIVDGEDVNFQNIKICLGDARNNDGGSGGGVYSPSGAGNTLAFNKVTLSNNSAIYGGGVWASENGPITFTNCTITNNDADQVAGGLGLWSGDGNISITGTTISNNNAGANGGGASINVWSGSINITKCIVHNNTAGVRGGGLHFYSDPGIITITDCDIRYNDAGGLGGGIFATSDSGLRISRTQVRANTAHSAGGLYASGIDNLVIHRSTFDHNTASRSAGGVYLYTLNGTITNSTFGYNHAKGGGAFFISKAGVDFDSCTIAYNYADTAGSAFFLTAGAVVTFQNCIIAKNQFAPGQFAGTDDPISNGHNLLSFDDTGAFNGPGDLKGTEAAPLNPGLSVLGYWNGGTTKTFPLLSTILDANGVRVRNKAINNGLTDLTNDQNGNPRGPKDDIGAYEKAGQD